jgi:hypothetical protein
MLRAPEVIKFRSGGYRKRKQEKVEYKSKDSKRKREMVRNINKK